MAEPGWYADPTAPQGRRYWDGQRWMETGHSPRRGPGAALWLLIALVVIGGVIAAIIMFPAGSNPFAATPEDNRSARPTGTQWNELVPTETPSPTPIETGFGQPIECPTADDYPRSEIRDGRLHGGGLSIEPPSGSRWEQNSAWIDWLYESNGMTRDIALGWMSNVNVGYIKVSDGFSPVMSTAAEQFVTCMASSGMFLGFERRELLINEDYVVSDRIGWRLTSNIFVGNMADQDIEGDVVDIILVPTDDKDRFAVYVSCVTIGHDENRAEVDVSLNSLRFDG
ncbi:DUF2510 domain-containing protein [Tessaracoccus sp. G1721]